MHQHEDCMSFDDDFDIPLTDTVVAQASRDIRSLDDMDVGMLPNNAEVLTGHFYTVYPYYFNSNRLPKYIRDGYIGVDITIYHLTKILAKLGYKFNFQYKRHPADLLHVGRVHVFTSIKKRQLLIEIAKALPSCFEEFDKELLEFKTMADNGDASKEEFIMTVDPFFIPKSMRKEEKPNQSTTATKKIKKSKKK